MDEIQTLLQIEFCFSFLPVGSVSALNGTLSVRSLPNWGQEDFRFRFRFG